MDLSGWFKRKQESKAAKKSASEVAATINYIQERLKSLAVIVFGREGSGLSQEQVRQVLAFFELNDKDMVVITTSAAGAEFHFLGYNIQAVYSAYEACWLDESDLLEEGERTKLVTKLVEVRSQLKAKYNCKLQSKLD